MGTVKLVLVLTAAALGLLGALHYINTDEKPSIRGRMNLGIKELELRTALFRDWMLKYRKSYSQGEIHHRFLLWNKAYEYVQEHNSKGASWTAALNKFADLSDEEFTMIYNGADYDPEIHEAEVKILDESKILKDIDWRDKGAVTPMKDQGMCGSCYAFAAVGGLEGIYAIAEKKLYNLSEQQIMDCTSNRKYGNAGCKSGFIPNSLKYTKENGIELMDDYPYKEELKNCSFDASKVIFNNSGYKMVLKNNFTQLKAAVSIQPISVAIQATDDAFKYYEKGVLTANCSCKFYGHAVTVIGFIDDYWIVKNSWGDDWGMKGYMFLQMGDQNNGSGLCGVNRFPFYPTYKKGLKIPKENEAEIGVKLTEENENETKIDEEEADIEKDDDFEI